MRAPLVYHWSVMADSEPAVFDATAAAVPLPQSTDRTRPNARVIALLALGHFMIDMNQGALPALLPFIRSAHHLSYAGTGTIVLAGNLTSSIIQPLFGYLADQTARRWMLPLSVALSGVGIALLGIAPSYWTVLGLVLAMGLGVAAYHPEGYKAAASAAGDKRATALSWFALGGNAGIALGAPAMTALVAVFGLGGSLGMLGPTALAAGLFVAFLPAFGAAERHPAAKKLAAEGRAMPGAMALLIFVVTLRSWAQLGFTTFVPFYYVDSLKADPHVVGTLLFVFLGGGALGTMIGGPLADRWGSRTFMIWGLGGVAPLAALFLWSTGPLAFVALGLMGAVLVSTFTVSVVLAQQYLPRNHGMASGLIVGFASGTGGLGVTFLGWLADHWSLMGALWISAMMPLAGFAAAWFLPAPRAQGAKGPCEGPFVRSRR
jgi:FSR family fosmidomycin resistance protein-like MFS transporter